MDACALRDPADSRMPAFFTGMWLSGLGFRLYADALWELELCFSFSFLFFFSTEYPVSNCLGLSKNGFGICFEIITR